MLPTIITLGSGVLAEQLTITAGLLTPTGVITQLGALTLATGGSYFESPLVVLEHASNDIAGVTFSAVSATLAHAGAYTLGQNISVVSA